MSLADCSPEAAAAVAAWQPSMPDDDDLAHLEPLLPQIRGWVAVVSPQGRPYARLLMYVASRILVWTSRQYGFVDAASVLSPETVESNVIDAEAGRSVGWKRTVRAALRNLGRAVNPDAWEPRPATLCLPPVSSPYTDAEDPRRRSVGEERQRAVLRHRVRHHP